MTMITMVIVTAMTGTVTTMITMVIVTAMTGTVTTMITINNSIQNGIDAAKTLLGAASVPPLPQ
jgi:hypothetical protein